MTVALVAVAVPAAALSIPSAAVAIQHRPRGIFAVFADCPLANPAVALCMFAQITHGEFVLGKESLPIDRTITLQGGLIHAPGRNPNAYVLADAEDGDTMSRTALSLPEGLFGAGEATATPELAEPASSIRLDIASLIENHGAALTIPFRVTLNGSAFGSCDLGSAGNPIAMELTDGTTSPPPPNLPITGGLGTEQGLEEDGLEALAVGGASVVNNSFSVPAATGCSRPVAALIVDAIVGLPSRPGHNTAILKANIELASAAEVKASETG
jgi:hypothetical protein